MDCSNGSDLGYLHNDNVDVINCVDLGNKKEKTEMKEEYIGISIEDAKELADKYQKSQVIIFTWDKFHETEHVVTYGNTAEDSVHAARGGNFIKKALGWPENLCKSIPKRCKNCDKKYED